MADVVDPWLPARLRRLSFVRRAENAIRRAWFRSLSSWMDEIRPGVMSPYRDSGGTIPPDPAFITATNQAWVGRVTDGVIPSIARTAYYPWGQITGGPRAQFDQDAYIRQYLADSTNRLSNIPNEVYARIVGDIQNGINNGSSIPDIAADIERTLTATGSDLWPNRATLVARTETIGATNAGAFAGAQRAAIDREDLNPQKVWLATEDDRTRPAHKRADLQQVGLAQPFLVDGFPLMFPGDPAGPPELVIQCRCTMLDVVAGETIDWTSRQFQTDPWADENEE